MALTALIAITLASIAWSLWIRRVTWRCRWEVAATLNIALQGCAVALMSPAASATIGVSLHDFTGKWNLEDYIGHDCYIVAASAIVYNALGRLSDDDMLQDGFKQYVERPATLCIPVLLATFSLGNGARIYRADFFDVPTDFWLNMYWLVLCGTLIYLLGLRHPRATGPAQRPAIAAHRERCTWSLRLAESSPASCRITTAFVQPLQPIEGGSSGVAVRMRVRRRFRVGVGVFLAAEGQVV